MDLGFHDLLPPRGAANPAFAGEIGTAPDWHELYPRLCAGWHARRALLSGEEGDSARRGNFDPASAQALAGFGHGSHVVNPTVSANRKPDGGKALSLSGVFQPGTRG